MLGLSLDHQTSLNLHMPVVVFEGIWWTKPFTGCQIQSTLFIVALSTFHFPPVLSLSLTQSNTVPLPLSLTGLPPGCLLQSVWSWSSITADFSSTWNSATWNLPEVRQYKVISSPVAAASVYNRCQELCFLSISFLCKSCIERCGVA